MSTNNFSYQNILFVSDIDDEFIYDDTIANIQADIEDFDTMDEHNNNRSYPGKTILEKTITDYGRKSVKVQIHIISGYYGGFNIDYTVETFFDGYEDDSIELSQTELKKIQSFENRLKKILKRTGMAELNHIGTASNGEAFYEKR